MNKKKLLIGTMIVVFLISLLKATSLPGVGIIWTLVASSAAFLFMTVIFRRIIRKKTEETKSPTYTNVIEAIFALSLAIFTIGILSRFQHWPGGSFYTMVGSVLTTICALLVLITYRKTTCAYYSNAIAVSIASIIFVIILGSMPFYYFIERTRWSGYDCIEYEKIYRENPTAKNQKIYSSEKAKAADIKDKEQYNELNATYKKALEEAEKNGAKVLYVFDHLAYDVDIPEAIYGINLKQYLKCLYHQQVETHDFILVYGGYYASDALSDLENTPWQTDSFTVKYGDEIYKFGPNIR